MREIGRHLPIAVMLLWLLGGLLPGGLRGETFSLSEYRDRIGRAVAYLEGPNVESGPQKKDALSALFPEEFKVRDGDRTVSVTRRSVLPTALLNDTSPRAVQRMLSRLKALEAQISGSAPGQQPGLSGFRAKLDEVYRGREFAHLKERTPASRLTDLFEYIRKLLDRLRELMPSPVFWEGKWLQVAAYGVLLLIGLVLTVWFVRNFRGVGWQRHVSNAPSPLPPKVKRRPWTSWREEAHRKRREGAYREAVRCLFLSVMLEGEEKGWWSYDPHATNNEHLTRMSETLERRAALSRLMQRYEKVWYGMAQPSESDYRQYEGWVRQMENAP